MTLRQIAIFSCIYLIVFVLVNLLSDRLKETYYVTGIIVPYFLTLALSFLFFKEESLTIRGIVFVTILLGSLVELGSYFRFDIQILYAVFGFFGFLSIVLLIFKKNNLNKPMVSFSIILLFHTIILPQVNRRLVRLIFGPLVQEGNDLTSLLGYYAKIRFLNYWETKLFIFIILIWLIVYRQNFKGKVVKISS